MVHLTKFIPNLLLPVNKYIDHLYLREIHYLQCNLLQNTLQHKEESHYLSRWHGFLSNLGISVASGLHIRSRRMIQDKMYVPEYVLSSMPGPETLHREWSLPAFINMFLPEFPYRGIPVHEHFQVIPKSEILRLGVLDQSKEEVIIQRQLRHPFVHDLLDCWQTQHHLYIMFDYCSTGDLYTYWVMIGQFGEEAIKVFAAELGSALGFLHDFGIIHRDVKMENILLSDQGHLRLADFGLSRRLERGGRAFTICGTIQYMAPEVLGGGPYSHAADWWSLGILLFALANGKFPVPPESDHCCMLRKVRCFLYEIPRTFSAPFALLLAELLCKTPTRRLRTLGCFKRQSFFRGTPFDSQLLQKKPVDLILELKKRPDRPEKACRGLALEPFPDFDFVCDFVGDLNSASAQETLTLTKVKLVEAFNLEQVPQGNDPQRALVWQDPK
ncbi:putative serine/threonine-protein kinase F31E3.2 isoform X1 [Silurus asotus]|uniref:Serine/threonine-protein kinase F31E3.2 isoform X1 n=1 Tax=Silurus asotus TaxID=30991 RepID=A0AAD5AP66_SILAS|nr:putative serine/threonine-protein kinase F31E3.2 isoform X1 [Silurus asotus]